MDFLARKITRAKWYTKPWMQPDAVRADAMTACLRTTDDTLSLWECEGSEDDIQDVVLALMATADDLETMDVVLLSRQELTEGGFVLHVTPDHGNTPVADLREKHVDIERLDGDRLHDLARRIARQVRDDIRCPRFTRKQVLEIVRVALSNGRLSPDQLRLKVREAVGPTS